MASQDEDLLGPRECDVVEAHAVEFRDPSLGLERFAGVERLEVARRIVLRGP